ncbi:MAG: type II toxin-antitoxin system HicA family toxin [Candidatus Peregrinibacteria bacterium]|nr:type II toxin-antitoxin system HicA family toxin [Candidatus Peregrinibacteria bacterium]
MASIEKLLLKFLNNPSGIRYSELERLLLSLGFEKVWAKGSHVKFKHKLLQRDLIIPVHGGDCKEFYKSYAAKIIKKFII